MVCGICLKILIEFLECNMKKYNHPRESETKPSLPKKKNGYIHDCFCNKLFANELPCYECQNLLKFYTDPNANFILGNIAKGLAKVNRKILRDNQRMASGYKMAIDNNASVMIIVKDGLVLGVSRKNKHDSFGLPGGKLNKDESSKDIETYMEAAIRETKEETNIDVTSCEFLFSRKQSDKRSFTHCFYAVSWSGEPTQLENFIVKWISVEELTGNNSAYPKYNTRAFKLLKSKFPQIELK